jgi:hypothetical protein
VEIDQQPERDVGKRVEVRCGHFMRLCPRAHVCSLGRPQLEHGLTHYLHQLWPIAQSDRVRLSERLPCDAILYAGPLIGPGEQVTQWLDTLLLVDGERALYIGTFGNVNER